MTSSIVALSVFLALTFTAFADWQPLWKEGELPSGIKVSAVQETVNQRGSYTDTALPGYQVVLPDPAKRSGAAVVIFPGGGYSNLAMNHEGHAYAAWLKERGIVAVLVKYRVSSKDVEGFQFPAPLLDARRAIELTRERAKEWGVDPAKIGVMGSSAGGHLASMCATMADDALGEEAQRKPFNPELWRANFAILIYPVIAMNEPWGHMGSKRRLLGEAPSEALSRQVSTYLRVDPKTPPCFLVHAADDKVVPLRILQNSLRAVPRTGCLLFVTSMRRAGTALGLAKTQAPALGLHCLSAGWSIGV